MARKWEYRVTEPNLPSGATSPVMESQQMQEGLIAWTTTEVCRLRQPTGGAIASRRNGGYSVVQSNVAARFRYTMRITPAR
jgi:hypothetical protein